METTSVLGIKISKIVQEQAKAKVVEFLNSPAQHTIFTPNPEMAVKAQKDEYFKTVLNSGNLNLCDGFGLQIFSGVPRIHGVDFMMEICKIAAEQGKGVYLLGSGDDAVLTGACENLHAQFPNLHISGYNKGPQLDEAVLQKFDEGILEQINKSGAHILFVAFGMGKQEKWIHENLAKMPNIKVAMGVGGSFEFISGKIKRASLLLRKLGLEWLYRLVQQPKRLVRIWNATVVFTWQVMKQKLYAGNK